MLSDDVAGDYHAAIADPAICPLPANRIRTFHQAQIPTLDPAGHLMLAPYGGLCMSPDGHGGAITAMLGAGLLDWFESLGCTWLITMQADNPALCVADFGFVGLAERRGADAGVKAVRKTDPTERVGVVAIRDGRICIIEYTELTPAQSAKTLPDGSLAFKAASIACHCFRIPLLRAVATAAKHDPAVMPLHASPKYIPCLATGQTPATPAIAPKNPAPTRSTLTTPTETPIQPANTTTQPAPNGFKFERFIFDVLPHAATVLTLEVPRAAEFIPLKHADGPDGIASVTRRLNAAFQHNPTN
jgi:UDP-N-acetylglucosamine pyrophosphorylase